MTYGYTSNLLTSVTGPDGKTITFGYDASSRLTSITDANGHTQLTNTYDAAGNVSSQSDAKGYVTSFAYEPSADKPA